MPSGHGNSTAGVRLQGTFISVGSFMLVFFLECYNIPFTILSALLTAKCNFLEIYPVIYYLIYFIFCFFASFVFTFLLLFFQFLYSIRIHFRKIIYKVERVLYFMSDACGKLSKRSHFFCLYKLGLRGF